MTITVRCHDSPLGVNIIDGRISHIATSSAAGKLGMLHVGDRSEMRAI